MAASTLTLSDDQLLGEYVALDRFRGFIEQRLAIGPDLLALLIRDGQIVTAAHGANVGVGGFWRGIKDALFGRHALRLLIADLKPFQLRSAVEAVTQDHVQVAGELTIDLQVNPERPANVLGLMKDRSNVTKANVLERISPHLGDRVLEATVRRVNALDLRGNVAMQDKVQSEVMREVERIAGDLGLLVRSVALRWAFNEDEIAAIRKRAREREQEMAELDFRILERSIAREGESTILQLRTDLDVEKVKAASEAELRRMILDQELGFVDARETGIRIEQMKVLRHELDLAGAERRDRLVAEIEAADHAIALARERGALQGVDLANDEVLRRYQITAARLRMELREVERSVEDADTRQALALKRLEELQNLEIAEKAREQQIRGMRDLQGLEISGERDRLDLEIKGGDAEHQRRMEAKRLETAAEAEKLRLMREMSPDLVLAINAGVSPAVANVLVEQARARAGDTAEKMQLMRDMIEQSREARIATEAQARHFFEQGMQGAAGVAQGVGNAAAVARGDMPQAAGGGSVECAACHRNVPATDRFCRYCGRPMRA